MFVLDNNNGGNDTPELTSNTKYDKLIPTSDPTAVQETLVDITTYRTQQKWYCKTSKEVSCIQKYS